MTGVLAFFLIALLAAVFGFGQEALAFAATARLLFYGAVALFLVTFIGHVMPRV